MEQTAKYEVATIDRYDMTSDAMSPDTVMRQVHLIQQVMKEAMHEGEHYGVIPGCGTKPSLLKPGAEKLSLTFRLAPSYEVIERDMPKNHREYRVKCTLTHIPSNTVFGEGVGACSTMEGKYRFRKAEQKCPECGKETIIKGKKEYGGGWICFAKKGGCGAKFKDGDPAIENQNMGRIEHDNPADYYNTVLKMAKKRAHVDATLTATAASDIFTQDVEDMEEVIGKNGASRNVDSNPFDEPEKPRTPPQSTQTDKPMSDAQKKKVYAMLKTEGLSDEEIRDLTGKHGLRKEQNPTSKQASDFFDNFRAVMAEFRGTASWPTETPEPPDEDLFKG